MGYGNLWAGLMTCRVGWLESGSGVKLTLRTERKPLYRAQRHGSSSTSSVSFKLGSAWEGFLCFESWRNVVRLPPALMVPNVLNFSMQNFRSTSFSHLWITLKIFLWTSLFGRRRSGIASRQRRTAPLKRRFPFSASHRRNRVRLISFRVLGGRWRLIRIPGNLRSLEKCLPYFLGCPVLLKAMNHPLVPLDLGASIYIPTI